MRPLSEKEVDVVYKWLGVRFPSLLLSFISSLTQSSLLFQFLVNFFHGGGEGVPLEDLRNAKYLGACFLLLFTPTATNLLLLTELIEARMYYEWSPDDLMRASVETSSSSFLLSLPSIATDHPSPFPQCNAR
jgi:hypothetical protein